MERNEWSEDEQAEFERKLRFALRHRATPLGLKGRVLARSRERAREGRRAQGGRFWMLQRIAASAVLAAVFGGFAVYEQTARREQLRAEQRKGQEAREQVMLALRITHKTLDRVGERLADNGR